MRAECYLLAAYVAWLALAAAAFHLLPVLPAGNGLSPERAAFFAVNLGTLTGFTFGFSGVADLTGVGELLVIVHVLVCAWLVLSAAALGTARLLGFTLHAPAVLWRVAFVLFASAAMGFAVGDLLLGLSAVSNLGLPAGGRVAAEAYAAPAFRFGVLLPAVAFGAVGVGLLDRTWAWRLAGVYAGGCLVAFLLLSAGGLAVGLPAWEAVRQAQLAAVDLRSAGFGFVPPAETHRASLWLQQAVMLLGGGVAGAGGGLRAEVVLVLLLGMAGVLRGRAVGRLFAPAALWAAALLATVFVGVWLLLAFTAELPVARAVFVATSAACNVGASADTVSLTGPGLWTLTGLMLAGRVGFLVLLAFYPAGGNEEHRGGRSVEGVTEAGS